MLGWFLKRLLMTRHEIQSSECETQRGDEEEKVDCVAGKRQQMPPKAD